MKARKLSVAHRLVLALSTLLLAGCPKREEIKAEMWLQSGIPAKVCAEKPEVAKSGIYRRLNDDVCKAHNQAIPCYEFLSYCKPQVAHYFSILDSKFNDLLDKYLPEKK